MSNQNGVTIYGKFETFESVLGRARAAATNQHETITALLSALADFGNEGGPLISGKRFDAVASCLLLFMEQEKAQSQQSAYVNGFIDGCSLGDSTTVPELKASASEKYPSPAPSHIDDALAEHLAQDTGGDAQAQVVGEVMRPKVTREQVLALIKKHIFLGGPKNSAEIGGNGDLADAFVKLLANQSADMLTLRQQLAEAQAEKVDAQREAFVDGIFAYDSIPPGAVFNAEAMAIKRYPDAAQGQEQQAKPTQPALPVRVCDNCGCRYTKPATENRDGLIVSVCPKCGGQWYEIEGANNG